MIGAGIGITKVSSFGQGGGFSPFSLFANGEQGAWYDPSDLSTLFQDSAGTTPVTAGGQPVGLMLDKSGNGNHASQATTAAKPNLVRAPLGGVRNLLLDSTDGLTSQWINGSVSRTSGGAWELGQKTVLTTPTGVDFHRMQAAVTNRPAVSIGQTLFCSCIYEAGSSGRILVRVDGVHTDINGATGIAGALTASGVATNIVNTDLGNGRYKVTFQITATVAGDAFIEVGPNSTVAGENVVFLGAQLELGSVTAFQKVTNALDVTEAGVQTLSWLEFDGVDDFIRSDGDFDATPPMTVAVAFRDTPEGSNQSNAPGFGINKGNVDYLRINPSTLDRLSAINRVNSSEVFADLSSSSGAAPNGQPSVGVVTHKRNFLELRTNQNDVVTSDAGWLDETTSSPTWRVSFSTRAGIAATLLPCSYQDALVVARELTTSEKEALEAHLANKSGVTL